MKIKILKDGPYMVSKDIPLKEEYIELDPKGEKWVEGNTVQTPQGSSYLLCRCGHSKTYPFCDGSHKNVQWNSEEVANKEGFKERALVYEGPSLKLFDIEELCAHIKFCNFHRGVWLLTRNAEDGSEEEDLVMHMCESCSSGRLNVEKDGKALECDLPKEISLTEDKTDPMYGPIWVKGGIDLESHDGTKYEPLNRMTLCRCGQSKNMPFCDGEHRYCKHMEK